MNTTSPPPFTDVPERIAQIIWVLCQTVTERFSIRALTREQVEYICRRLLGIRTRFRRLVERVRAGKLPRERARKPRARQMKPEPEPQPEPDFNRGFSPPPGWRRWAAQDRAAEKLAALNRAAWETPAPTPLWKSLRQDMFAWLCRYAPSVPGFRGSAARSAEELRRALAEPEMQDLLRTSRIVGDSLRALCHMLGVDRKLIYPAPLLTATDSVAPTLSSSTPAESHPATPTAAARVAPRKTRAFRAAPGRPPPTRESVAPSSRASPGPGVVVIDYWDWVRG